MRRSRWIARSALVTMVAVMAFGVMVGRADALATVQAAELTQPTNAFAQTFGQENADVLGSVGSAACGADGSCVSVGEYAQTTGASDFVAYSEADGSWNPGVQLPVPGNAVMQGSGELSSLDSVACPAAGSCLAVGQYNTAASAGCADNASGLAESETGSAWKASQIALAGNVCTLVANSVACSSTSSCTAVGSGGSTGAWLADGSVGSLGAAEPVSAPADESGVPDLDAVSCGPGLCAALGSTPDGASFLLTKGSGPWGSASDVPVPAGGTAGSGTIAWVACSNAACYAAGSYEDGSDTAHGLILTTTGGAWTATSTAGTGYRYISCAMSGGCVASSTGASPDEANVQGTWTPLQGPGANASYFLCTTSGPCFAALSSSGGSSVVQQNGAATTSVENVTAPSNCSDQQTASSTYCQNIAAVSACATTSCVDVTTYPDSANDEQIAGANLSGSTVPSLTIHPAVVSEPARGSLNVPVAVTLSAASSSTVTVDYATQDGAPPGGATAAHGDYTPASGVLSFAPGQTTATITVTVNASGLTANAGFSVVLSYPGNAAIAVGTATVQITQERTTGVAVKCLAQTAGSLVDTCAVTVSDTSGRTPAVSPTGFVTVTASAGSVGSGGSCGGATSTGGVLTCKVSYTPPAGVGSAASPPVMTAAYSGDANFVPASGTETLGCTSGAVFQLTSITSSAPSANGFEIDEPVTLHGCGFTAASQAQFGSDGAVVTPATAADVSSDAKSMTVDVPEFAITGPLSVTDTSQPVPRTVTLGTPNPLPIDSWRNTNGFNFPNYGSNLTEDELLDEFPKSSLTLSGSVLRPWAQSFLMARMKDIAGGICFGMALTSGEFGDGSLLPATLSSSAKTGFDLDTGSDLDQFLAKQWLAQYADQALPYKLAGIATSSLAGVERQLTSAMGAMGGTDGFQHPAVISVLVHLPPSFLPNQPTGWVGHAEVAYGWSEVSGVIYIHTADSNIPFTAAEDRDTTDATHETALQDSWIAVKPSGFLLPHEGLIGYFVPAGPTESLGRIIVTPVAAFERPLTLSRASSLGTAATLTLTPADQVQSVTGATGTPLSPSGTSPQLMIDPIVSASDTTVGGGSGIADLRLAAGRGAVTLDAGHRPVQVLWQSADTDASLTSSPGHVVTGFDARTGALTLSPKRGTSAPRTATVQLTDKLDGDRSERILTVTGPPDVSAVLTGAHAVLTSARSGRFTISLSSLGAGQMAQSAGLGTILLAAGQKLTVTPGRWSALAGATVNARVVGGRRATRRLRLRDRLRIPTAHVIDAAAHGSSVRVTVRIPALPIGAASVSISIRATRHGRLLGKGIASLPAGGRARTDRTTITLRHPIQTGARLAIIVQTVAGGATPTEATSTHVSRSD